MKHGLIWESRGGGGPGWGGAWLHPTRARTSSDLYDELRVGVGEALKLVLVQVHDEELVCGRQLHRHLGELLVEVAHVAARFLSRGEERRPVSALREAVVEEGGRRREHIDGKGGLIALKTHEGTRVSQMERKVHPRCASQSQNVSKCH